MIEKKTQLHSVEVRVTPDGVVNEAFATYRHNIIEDGVVTADTGSFTTALSAVQDGDRITIAKALGDALTPALLAKEAAELAYAQMCTECEAQDREMKAKDANIQKLMGDVEDLTTRTAGAEARATSLVEENIVLRHEVLTLRAQVLGTEPPAPLEEWRKQFEEPTPEA